MKMSKCYWLNAYRIRKYRGQQRKQHLVSLIRNILGIKKKKNIYILKYIIYLIIYNIVLLIDVNPYITINYSARECF